MRLFLIITILILIQSKAHAIELIIGEEKEKPGIVYIFEGAVKDTVHGKNINNLKENQTNIHIEARINWDNNKHKIPKGATPNGFIPYINVAAKITNQKTKISSFIDLLPHLNLIDNYHYARNITLPGDIKDKYTVEFYIKPSNEKIIFHNDWYKKYNSTLTKQQYYKYKNIDFEQISRASRK